MRFSRREILKGMGAAGVTPLLITACGGSANGSPPLPELPEYEWNGPIGPETLFAHGVASGDPLPEAVVIWTRVTTDASEAIEVWWEMALDEAFTQRTAQGTATTDGSRDFTVKVDVSDLVWGRNYYYRFAVQGRWSSTGRTRLAPKGGDVSKLRFGVCSCANYGFGYFHGYRHMAGRADLDAVVHLGDYFYEYGRDEYPDPDADPPEQLRLVDPPEDTWRLEDYRTRFGQYRRDPDLQECHRQHPFIVVWDDHETANNSWMGGAENHNKKADQGSWEDRVAAARQAFFEWIPIRENTEENPNRELYRSLSYGDLADIIMLDTRIEGREQQLGALTFAPDDPNLPKRLISADQEAWLKGRLMSSTARWKILGNQVVMGLWQSPGGATYFNDDQWNGYPEGRGRLMGFLRDNVSDVVVVTGDVHSSWAVDVTVGDGSYDPDTQEGAVAVEFVTPGVTSPSGITPAIADAIVAGSPHIRYFEVERRGYFVLDIQQSKVQADWYLLDGIDKDQGNETLDASWAVRSGEKRVIEMDGPETPNPSAPPAVA